MITDKNTLEILDKLYIPKSLSNDKEKWKISYDDEFTNSLIAYDRGIIKVKQLNITYVNNNNDRITINLFNLGEYNKLLKIGSIHNIYEDEKSYKKWKLSKIIRTHREVEAEKEYKFMNGKDNIVVTINKGENSNKTDKIVEDFYNLERCFNFLLRKNTLDKIEQVLNDNDDELDELYSIDELPDIRTADDHIGLNIPTNTITKKHEEVRHEQLDAEYYEEVTTNAFNAQNEDNYRLNKHQQPEYIIIYKAKDDTISLYNNINYLATTDVLDQDIVELKKMRRPSDIPSTTLQSINNDRYLVLSANNIDSRRYDNDMLLFCNPNEIDITITQGTLSIITKPNKYYDEFVFHGRVKNERDMEKEEVAYISKRYNADNYNNDIYNENPKGRTFHE